MLDLGSLPVPELPSEERLRPKQQAEVDHRLVERTTRSKQAEMECEHLKQDEQE